MQYSISMTFPTSFTPERAALTDAAAFIQWKHSDAAREAFLELASPWWEFKRWVEGPMALRLFRQWDIDNLDAWLSMYD
jgi:hypothetical protein